MRKIKLTKGKFAIIDEEDFITISQYNWNYCQAGYAERRVSPRKIIRMHTFLVPTPKGMMIDHKNGNGLDNRRSNLRLCTKSQNMMNRGKTLANKSGYKGVYYDTFTKRWKAQIKVGKKNMSLGRFDTPQEAALAYDKACKIYHGEFAKLNYGK